MMYCMWCCNNININGCFQSIVHIWSSWNVSLRILKGPCWCYLNVWVIVFTLHTVLVNILYSRLYTFLAFLLMCLNQLNMALYPFTTAKQPECGTRGPVLDSKKDCQLGKTTCTTWMTLCLYIFRVVLIQFNWSKWIYQYSMFAG